MVTKLFVPDRRIVVPKPPSYLKLDMAFAIGAGTKLMDKSRYRSHGTISGADWADGAHGRCLNLNAAIPDYVEIPAAYTQLNFETEDFSLVARIKGDSFSTYPRLFCRGSSLGDGYQFLVHLNGYLFLRTSQLGANQDTKGTTGDLVIATWYTIGFSRAGAVSKLYLNGVDVTAISVTHKNPASSSRSVKIGVYDDKSNNAFDGKIEFLRIFGGIALPASAHLAWHNALA